jgi:hypothetical protein
MDHMMTTADNHQLLVNNHYSGLQGLLLHYPTQVCFEFQFFSVTHCLDFRSFVLVVLCSWVVAIAWGWPWPKLQQEWV